MKGISIFYISGLLILISAFPLITDQVVNQQPGVVWYFWVGIVIFLSGLFLFPIVSLINWVRSW